MKTMGMKVAGFVVAGVFAMMCNGAMAVSCWMEKGQWGDTSANGLPLSVVEIYDSAAWDCKEAYWMLYGIQCDSDYNKTYITAVHTCSSCPDGYGVTETFERVYFTDTAWIGINDIYGTTPIPMYDRLEEITVYTCEKLSCKGWAAYGPGYEKCTNSLSYRCAAGYYGTSTDGRTGCTRCPAQDNGVGTSAAGVTTAAQCYMPADTVLTDDSGDYVFSSKCYYSE